MDKKSNYQSLIPETNNLAEKKHEYQSFLPNRSQTELSFEYSENHVDCIELVNYSKNNLPVLVRVETGFMGQDIMHCYGKGDVSLFFKKT